MPSRALTLRLARPADSAAVAALTREQIEAGLAPRYFSSRIARLIRHPDSTVLVAEEGALLQGFAVMTFGDERAHLVLLAVQPGQRRSGIGRRIIEWLVQSAQVAGIASIHLELRADNPAAHAFYRALGFSETLRVAGYYEGRIDAIRMLRMLRA